MTAPLFGSPTESGIIGQYRNAAHQDIFQTYDADGSLLAAMNYQGAVYSGNSGLYASVAPLIANVVISSAQLKALHSTQAVLIPAPGPNLLLYPQSYFVVYYAGTTPYTVTGGNGYIYLGWGGQGSINSTNEAGFFPDTGFLDQAASQIVANSVYSPEGIPLSQVVNQPLVLQTPDTLTLGNGTITMNISYAILTIL